MEQNDSPRSNTPAQGTRQPAKAVFSVIDKPDGTRAYWLRVGSGWINRDGSLTLRLDALPVNGVLQVRDDDRRDQAPTGGAR
ncbi:MAG: hypothetical protein U0326_37000 [Polyangiales bacterium]